MVMNAYNFTDLQNKRIQESLASDRQAKKYVKDIKRQTDNEVINSDAAHIYDRLEDALYLNVLAYAKEEDLKPWDMGPGDNRKYNPYVCLGVLHDLDCMSKKYGDISNGSPLLSNLYVI